MVSVLISRAVVLSVGTLYPAYRSFKAVRTKDVREYVKWMMYWIVFALYLCLETVADIFASFWVPFYYELKIIFVIWLISPYTKGASVLYRKLIHPALQAHEDDIDECLDRAKSTSYSTLVNIGTKGVQYAREVATNAVVSGHVSLVKQLKKSYSMSDIDDQPQTPLLSDNFGDGVAAPYQVQLGGPTIEEIVEEESESDADEEEDFSIPSRYNATSKHNAGSKNPKALVIQNRKIKERRHKIRQTPSTETRQATSQKIRSIGAKEVKGRSLYGGSNVTAATANRRARLQRKLSAPLPSTTTTTTTSAPTPAMPPSSTAPPPKPPQLAETSNVQRFRYNPRKANPVTKIDHQNAASSNNNDHNKEMYESTQSLRAELERHTERW